MIASTQVTGGGPRYCGSAFTLALLVKPLAFIR